jgi:hypothetical protein
MRETIITNNDFGYNQCEKGKKDERFARRKEK